MRRLAIALALAVSVGLMPTTAGAHDAPRRCGASNFEGAGWWDLRAHDGIGCPHARKLANKWHHRTLNGGTSEWFNVGERRWRCVDEPYGAESVIVRCRSRNDHRVHFKWGS